MRPWVWASTCFVLIFCFRPISCDCPRKQSQEKSQKSEGPPGVQPPEQFIQSTFIHNSITDDDRVFSVVVTEKLRELRQKLKELAKLTIDNENLDCNDHKYPKCREFPSKESYHFLIVEDATHGAVVYSIDAVHNKAKPELIENALLDAFSRHSSFSLMGYASPEAANSVGFVREVGVDELEKFMEDNQKKRDVEEPTIFMRSPFELQLLNERIIDLRSLEADLTTMPGLREFRAGELSELIDLDERRPVFVLFWTNVNTVSVHVYQLWKKVVARLYPLAEFKTHVIFGHVPCHEQTDLCTAFGVSQQDYRTVFAYRMSRKFASQFGIGDEDYYVNWIRMVMYGSPHKIESKDELLQARRGIISAFPKTSLPRPSITLGIFPDEESEEFRIFNKIAHMLNGRYHFAFYIQADVKPSISTIRPLEKTKRIDYNQGFDYSSLIAHVTQNSIPSVLDFSTGFTSDVVYRSSRPILLLLHNGKNRDLLQELSELAVSNEYKAKFYFSHIDSSYSLPIKDFLSQINVEESDLPILLELQKEEIRIIKRIGDKLVDSLTKLNDVDAKDRLVHKLERNKAHPLKYLQLEHVNKVFGVQEVELLPEPIISPTFSHGQMSLDVGAAGGCPMMQHLSGGHGHGHVKRDEL